MSAVVDAPLLVAATSDAGAEGMWAEAVAEQCNLPLATLDQRLARATGPRCRFLLPPLA